MAMDYTTAMPRYKCHKEVGAHKIKEIVIDDKGATITPAEPGYAPFRVEWAYVQKHLYDQMRANVLGGYFVVYEDGYQSFSPAKAFEEGYTRI